MKSPLELREDMISSLKRSLVGPSGPDDSSWLESPSPLGIVDKDFSWDEKYPIGPWVDEYGEEVLQTPPVFVYGVGILYPRVDEAVLNQVDVEQDRIIAEGDGEEHQIELEIDTEVVVAEASTDDGTATAESTTRPRTMAISFRVPESLKEVSLVLTGGSYFETHVLNQRSPWWTRTSQKLELSVSTLISNSAAHEMGLLSVSVGAEIHPQEDATKIVTIWIRNDTQASSVMEFSAKCLFQTSLQILCSDLIRYDTEYANSVGSLELLYRNSARMAVGHGTDVSARKIEDEWKLTSETLPVSIVEALTPDVEDDGESYAIGMADLADGIQVVSAKVNRLLANYETWIKSLEVKSKEVPLAYSETAARHVQSCKEFLNRMKLGWELLCSNSDAAEVLSDMSAAMNAQRVAYAATRREVSQATKTSGIEIEGVNPHSLKHKQSAWRPFQFAFLLANVSAIVQPESSDKENVDVIWMPTGGGKTEAYLGLAGFTILWERLQMSKTGGTGVSRSYTKIFMRYTLRLLTSQQMTRAASLICALELTRIKKSSKYGSNEIRIGAWLGSATSPNKRDVALKNLSRLASEQTDAKPFMVTRCPWCAAAIGHTLPSGIAGYRKANLPSGGGFRVMVYCPDTSCPFTFREEKINERAASRGLPILEVDEDIYEWPPDFVVATIDKIAQIAWVPEAQSLFGLRAGARRVLEPGLKIPGPTLFIQDELHLISGPLGSIDGLYETMLEYLCEVDGGRKPLIVAATATTKNFEEQLQNLYGRQGRLVPPPGLEIDDTFFARKDPKTPGKAYAAVCATGYGSALNAQIRVVSSLAHSAAVLQNSDQHADAWWTNIIFFSSRRALGQLHSQIETNIKNAMRSLRQWSGVKSGFKKKDGEVAPSRYLQNLSQLTATSSEDIGQVLESLSNTHESGNAIDVCLATSMIEVGLDVQRLGLMTVIGQPKSASQYIQVSGRVGRDADRPGLIVTVLSPQNVRDRSHYEGFLSWHERLYASVETSSVTPFTTVHWSAVLPL